MSLQKALDRAIAQENANPQGLPADILAGMDADIRANPDKYPALTAAMARAPEDIMADLLVYLTYHEGAMDEHREEIEHVVAEAKAYIKRQEA